MELSLDYIFLGLILLCFCATFFAFRSTAVLFRLGAAVMWLSLLMFISSDSRTLSMDSPWVYVLFLAILCMLLAILLLYIGKTIDQGFIVSKKKEKRWQSEIDQEEYREKIRNMFSKRKRY